MKRCVRLVSQYFEKAPPAGSDSESDVNNVWNKSFLSKFFFTFICNRNTKQRLCKKLYLLDKLSWDNKHALIQRVLNYSKKKKKKKELWGGTLKDP